MANSLAHSYQPSAAALGGTSLAAGKGQYGQKLSDRKENRYQLQAQADLQQQGQLLNYAINAKQLQNTANVQQQQMQMDWQKALAQSQMQQNQQLMAYDMQRMEQDDQLAYRQMMGQQELDLKRELGFAELDNQTQIQALRNRPQASAAWQEIKARENALLQARQDGYIDDNQYASMRENLAYEMGGFDVKSFPYEGFYEPGKDQGDAWDEVVDVPGMGPTTLKFTRDRSGMPVMTDASKIWYENAVKSHFEPAEQKSQWQQENATRDDTRAERDSFMKRADAVRQRLYDQEYQRLNPPAPAGSKTPPTIREPVINPEMIRRAMEEDEALYSQIRGAAGDPTFFGRVGGSSLPIPQGLQGMVGGELNQPGPRQGAYNVPQMPPMPQQQQQQTPLSMLRAQMPNVPPKVFAAEMVAQSEPLVIQHLLTMYPRGQRAQINNPDDMALFVELDALNKRRKR